MERDIAVDRRSDGSLLLKSRVPLGPYASHLPEFLTKWAHERPDQLWLAQRDKDGEWQSVTYAEGKRQVDSATEALLNIPGTTSGPLAILSGNSIEHAIIAMAAMQARIPVAPISTAYSLQSSDHAKLKEIFALLEPKTIFVQDVEPFAKALSAIHRGGMAIIAVSGRYDGSTTRYADLLDQRITKQVAMSIDDIDPDAPAKLLFTSGSTGHPKAVVLTHRMMCVNAAMIMQARLVDTPPADAKYLDWLPWNHVMGGNAVFNIVLAQGFSLYIDDGKPVPGQFDKTLRNLREISPITYANAPAGYSALAAALENDAGLCRTFFQNLRVLTYGGARLPDDIFDRFQALAVKTIGEQIVFSSTYGATETAPAATTTHWNAKRVGLIGLPCAGVELKLLPLDERKYEIRIRGACVTPGYYRRADLTAAAFDEDGFYKIGDVVEFVDPDDVREGLQFAGRVAEDFKLLSGTFVLAGALRVDAIVAMTPLVADVVVTGQDKDYVGLLAWPHVEACRGFLGNPSATIDEIIKNTRIREAIASGLRSHNMVNGNSGSRSVRRVILLADPPSVDGNEITDKGYINQRAAIARRAVDVARLYATPKAADVIEIDI